MIIRRLHAWRGLVALACALFPVAASTWAQPVSPGRYDGQPITAITLVGPAAPTLDALTALTKLRPGKPYSGAAIRRAVEKLFEIGEYTDVRVAADEQPDGVALIITFVAKVRLKDIEVRGHHQSTRRVHEVLRLRVGDEWRPDTATEAIEHLTRWYVDLGYVVTIRAETALEDQGTRIRVVFHVEEHDRLRIDSIRFPGHPAFSRARHLLALRTAAGEYVSLDQLDRGLARLADLYARHGYLKASVGPADIRQARDGLVITIPIERGPHYRIEISGDAGVGRSRLRDQLTLMSERRDDDDFLAEEADRLTRYLIDRGFRHATVRIQRVPREKDAVLLVVSVHAGPRFPLRAVQVVGSSASAEELDTVIRTTPSGPLRSRYADAGTMEADRERLLTWYRARGFLDPAISTEVIETLEPPSADVRFTVEEGPQTLIGAVRIEGAGQEFAPSLDPIPAQFQLTTGAPYVEARFRAARAAILAAYSERGHIYAAVNAIPTMSPDRTRVDLAFQIQEGLGVVIGPITLGGNERTRDHVILRELEVREGDIYNPRKILESQRRVARLGFLTEVRLEPNDPERVEAVKSLHLTVKERDAGTVDLGVGYANFEGLRGFSELSYRNLMGTGRRIGLRLEGSRLERKTVLGYREPWVFGQRMDGRAAVTGETKKEENRGYARTTYGVILGLDKRLSSTLNTSLVYDYQTNSFEETDTPGVLLPPNDRISSITPSVIHDTRDDVFNPTSGSVHAFAVENAALLLASQEQFWKVTAGSSQFYTLGRSFVGAVSLRTGVSNRFGETRANRAGERLLLPATKRFFLGGRSSVRGYDEDTLGPIGADGKPTGGNLMLVGNLELRIRLPKALGLVLFADGGNVWPNHQAVRWTDLKTTAGIGVRYHTPVGPLRLDYGHKLNWQPGERHGTFHFTLGHAF